MLRAAVRAYAAGRPPVEGWARLDEWDDEDIDRTVAGAFSVAGAVHRCRDAIGATVTFDLSAQVRRVG